MGKQRIKFNRSMMQRARRLLHMRYRPRELAEELGCVVDMIYRRYIPAGCPHERDDAGHIWIVGDEFRDWMLALRREAAAEGRAKLKKGQGYCVVCERAVDMEGPFEVRPVGAHVELVTGRCSECGAMVSRGRKRRAKQDD
jgi:hypothetical protein